MQRFLKWRCHGCSVYNSREDKLCSICNLPRGTPTPPKVKNKKTQYNSSSRKRELMLEPNQGKRAKTSFNTIANQIFLGFKLPNGWRHSSNSVVYTQFKATTTQGDPLPASKVIDLSEPQDTSSQNNKVQNSGEQVFVGFDFDETLVSRNASSLMFVNIKTVMKTLVARGVKLVVFSNESLAHMKKKESMQKTLQRKIDKVEEFLNKVGVDMDVYLATQRDHYRKPSTKDKSKHGANCGGSGMFTLYKAHNNTIQFKAANCFFVGDAAGRKSDHSDADKLFAQEIGLNFQTPEEFFLGDGYKSVFHAIGVAPPNSTNVATKTQSTTAPVEKKAKRIDTPTDKKNFTAVLSRSNKPVVVILCGIQGSGKSTFAKTIEELCSCNLVEYNRISQDELKTPKKVIESLRAQVADKYRKCIVVDRTNVSIEHRRELLNEVKDCIVLCVFLDTSVQESIKRCTKRKFHEGGFSSEKLSFRVLSNLVATFHSRLERPTTKEGFNQVVTVYEGEGGIAKLAEALGECVDQPLATTASKQKQGNVVIDLVEDEVEVDFPMYRFPAESGKLPFVGKYNTLPQYFKQSTSDGVYYRTDDMVVIYDAFPKAQVHLLIIPLPGFLNVQTVSEISPNQYHKVEKMQNLGGQISTRLEKQFPKLKFKLGYHIIPSLYPLHLHLISQDFDSPALKTKKHWNSFTTDFFLPSEKLLQVLKTQRNGGVRNTSLVVSVDGNGGLGYLSDLKARAPELLKGQLCCNVCNRVCSNMPKLKEHLKTH